MITPKLPSQRGSFSQAVGHRPTRLPSEAFLSVLRVVVPVRSPPSRIRMLQVCYVDFHGARITQGVDLCQSRDLIGTVERPIADVPRQAGQNIGLTTLPDEPKTLESLHLTADPANWDAPTRRDPRAAGYLALHVGARTPRAAADVYQGEQRWDLLKRDLQRLDRVSVPLIEHLGRVRVDQALGPERVCPTEGGDTHASLLSLAADCQVGQSPWCHKGRTTDFNRWCRRHHDERFDVLTPRVTGKVATSENPLGLAQGAHPTHTQLHTAGYSRDTGREHLSSGEL
jgi:hypothetical protein